MKRRHSLSQRKPSKEFGDYLKAWREQVPLTLQAAAPQLGLKGKNPGAHLSMWESGERPIPDAALPKISEGYGVPLEEVLKRAYWPQFILLPLIAIIDPNQLSKDLIEEIEKGLKEAERRELTQHIEELLSRRTALKRR